MPIEQAREVLVIRGQLNHADHFTPLRCASTFYVRQWPEVDASPYIVELLDSTDRSVNRDRHRCARKTAAIQGSRHASGSRSTLRCMKKPLVCSCGVTITCCGNERSLRQRLSDCSWRTNGFRVRSRRACI